MSAVTQGSLTFAQVVSGRKRDPKSTSALNSERDSNRNTHSGPSANGGQSTRPVVVNGSSGSGSQQPRHLAPIPAIFSGHQGTYPGHVRSDQTNQRLPEIRESPEAETASATYASHDSYEEAQHVNRCLPTAVTHETFELQPTNAANIFETEWSAAPTLRGPFGDYMGPELLTSAPYEYIPGGPPHTLPMPNSSFETYNTPPWAAGGPVSGTHQSTLTSRQRRDARLLDKLANLPTRDIIRRATDREAQLGDRIRDKNAAGLNALADSETMSGLRCIGAVLQEEDVDDTIREVANRMYQQGLQLQQTFYTMNPGNPDDSEWISHYWYRRFKKISDACKLNDNGKWAGEQAYMGAKRAQMLVSLVQSRHRMRHATLLSSGRT